MQTLNPLTAILTPWKVEKIMESPWGFKITASDGTVMMQENGVMYSPKQKTRQQYEEGFDFYYRTGEREAVIEAVKAQHLKAELIVEAWNSNLPFAAGRLI